MRGPFTALVAKDFRALLPVWAAAAATIAADPLVGRSGAQLLPLGIFAYIAGSLALGAHAIGHEYTNRTLAALFVQPWKRSSMLLTKAAVLFAMLLGLALIAWLVLFRVHGRLYADLPRYPTLILPVAGGLFVAPYLTMRLRSQMAGVVFTAAIPGTTYLLALLAGVSIYGIGSEAPQALAARVWPLAMVIFTASAAVLSARSFMRLQDTDGGGEELRLPRWLTIVDRSPIRPPLWMLVKKELRLQQMTFALVVLYGGIAVALKVAARLNPEFGTGFPVRGVGILYFALLPLLIGSLASAQERQFGMLQSQAMLPVAFSRQWAVKAGVVFSLALTLGVLLPWFVFAPPQLSREAAWPTGAAILILTAWSLYISSWCASGVIALALLLPASAAAVVAARAIEWGIASVVAGLSIHPATTHFLPLNAVLMLQIAIVAPVAVLLVYFASRNHRTTEWTIRRLALQAACLLAVFAATDTIATIVF